jgi:hypothetical protein
MNKWNHRYIMDFVVHRDKFEIQSNFPKQNLRKQMIAHIFASK